MHFAWSSNMVAFFITSILILICAILMLSVRKVIYKALCIGGVFIGCSAIYVMLGAEFVGVAQVLIYAGAITILLMFAIMLTNHEAEEPPTKWTVRQVASAVGAVLLGITLYLVIRSQTWPTPDTTTNVNGGVSNPIAIGLSIFKEYTIPFELVSLLLIVGLVGAVVLAQERKEDD